MRISSARTWLALALSLGVGGVNGAGTLGGADERSVTFADDDFKTAAREEAILILSELSRRNQPGAALPREFHWETLFELQVEKVNLYADMTSTGETGKLVATGKRIDGKLTSENPGGGSDDDEQTNTRNSPPPAATEASELVGRKPQGELPPGPPASAEPEPPLSVTVHANKTHGSVKFDNLWALDVYNSQPLYFGAVWGNGKGETYSRAFTVVNNQEDYAALRDNPNFTNSTPYKTEKIPQTSSLPVPFPAKPSASPGGDNDGNKESSSGGLAVGAIIGIAVACGVVGLVLAALGIWFLLRRRRSANNGSLGSGPGRPYVVHHSRADELIAEKEASTATTDHSPHSPYSDEGTILGAAPGIVAAGVPARTAVTAAAAVAPPSQARSYSPYSDRGSGGGVGGIASSPSTHAASIVQSEHTDTASRSAMGSPVPGRATPHGGLAPQYVHLVEEGMTEDEIRRLEDEERQLDAAIEQAGRR